MIKLGLGFLGEVNLNPVDWIPFGRFTVTHDGFTKDGIRVHVVREDISPRIVRNAMVISEKDLGGIQL